MASRNDILFGRIAVGLGFAKEIHIWECIKIQDGMRGQERLGEIMLRQGILTREQIAKILAVQQANRRREDEITRLAVEDVLFGQIALKHKWINVEQLHACLREQAMLESQGKGSRLGQILVTKGYLKPEQVRTLLNKQFKEILLCEMCHTPYNVINYNAAFEYRCRKCKGLLTPPATLELLQPDATISPEEGVKAPKREGDGANKKAE